MKKIVNVFFDASTYENILYVVYGDKKNSNLRRMYGKLTNNELEWYSLLFAVRLVNKKFSNCNVKIQGDSKLVVNQINGKWKIKKEELGVIADQVNGELEWGKENWCNDFNIVWDKRDRNKAGVRLEKYIGKLKRRGDC